MGDAELGPIWRSMRRHRAFSLTVAEVALGFFIVGNLILTCRWFASLGLPPSGHRQEDVVEVTVRSPNAAADVARRHRELEVLQSLSDVQLATTVSATQIDDRWGLPNVFWPAPGVQPAGPSACPEVARSAAGVVVGWGVDAGAALADVVDFRFAEGAAPNHRLRPLPSDRGFRAPVSAEETGTVIITQCLRLALFGARPVVGELLMSSRRPAARIVGVIEDVRMRVPFLYQTQLTAIFTGAPAGDERLRRYLLRTKPGRGQAVRSAVAPALGQLLGPGPSQAEGRTAGDPDLLITARLFDPATTRSAEIASGTVVVLVAVGLSLGVVAVLGNLVVAAFLVGDRRRVIGIRRALGATRWDIFRYLLIETLLPTQIGNLLGLALILASLPAAERLFSGMRLHVTDVVASAALLSLGGLAAKLLPAFRATRIPPSEVSRVL